MEESLRLILHIVFFGGAGIFYFALKFKLEKRYGFKNTKQERIQNKVLELVRSRLS